MPDYNTCRRAFGLPAAKTFADITPDEQIAATLKDLYGSVDNIGGWRGVSGGALGLKTWMAFETPNCCSRASQTIGRPKPASIGSSQLLQQSQQYLRF